MTTEEEKIFMHGFNQGYFLEQHDKDLLDPILNAKSESSSYLDGIRDGKQMAIDDRMDKLLKKKDNRKTAKKSVNI